MRRIRKLIKDFKFRHAEDRPVVTLGTDTRINPKTNRAQLKRDAAGDFPLTADLFVKTRLTNPQSVRKWIGFEATTIQKKDVTNTVVTSTRYRLSDGTTDFFWDGFAWVAAGAGDWSTEADVADNISTFDAAPRKIQVIANLETTDATQTPELIQIKILYEAVIEFMEDMIYSSLIPLIRSSIRPISRFVFEMPATGTTIALSDVALETGYNVVDIDSAFNFTTDPDLLIDIFSSFDIGTGTITLSTSVPAGEKVFVRFIYEAVVAVTTSQDFIDSETLPSLILTDIALLTASTAPSGDESVANKTTLDAVVVPSPLRGHLSFTIIGMTDKAVDNQRLLEAVNSFFENTPFVNSVGIDEGYRLHLIDEYAAIGEPGQAEIHMARATFLIRDFTQWLKDARDEKIVGEVVLSFSF